MRIVELVSHSRSLFREACQPDDFAHHAVLRDAHPQLFEALHRDLRLRLYEGRVGARGAVRSASLRQGLPFSIGATLCTLGALGLSTSLLAGSELGHAFRWHAWDGGLAQAAVPVAPLQTGAPLPLAAVALGLLAAGILIACLGRKCFWLVAQPAAADGRIDLWIAATSWRHEAAFAAEFAAFLQRAMHLNDELRQWTSECAAGVAPGEDAASERAVSLAS